MGGWHKLSDTLTMRLLYPQPALWCKDNPCPEQVACIELTLLGFKGEADRWTSRKLAARWGVSRRFAQKVIEEVAKDAARQGHDWAIHLRSTDRATVRSMLIKHKQELKEEGDPVLGQKRSTNGPQLGPHARVLLLDLDQDHKKQGFDGGGEAEQQSATPNPHRPAAGGADHMAQWRQGWNAYAQKNYPNEQSAMWDGGRNFLSPKESSKQLPLLECGEWLPRILELYLACCDAGKDAFSQQRICWESKVREYRQWAQKGHRPKWANGVDVGEVGHIEGDGATAGGDYGW